jgi:hypothetical protein
MTVDCFKEFCIKADTQQAKKIRVYYLKLEKTYFNYILQQNERNQKLIKEKVIIENHPKNDQVVYHGCFDFGGKTYLKYGNTNDLSQRSKQHKRDYGNTFILNNAKSVYNSREMENKIKNHPEIKYKHKDLKVSNRIRNEVIELNDQFDKEKFDIIFLDVTNNNKIIENNIKMEDVKLKHTKIDLQKKKIESQVELKRIESQVELKRLELEIKKLELQQQFNYSHCQNNSTHINSTSINSIKDDLMEIDSPLPIPIESNNSSIEYQEYIDSNRISDIKKFRKRRWEYLLENYTEEDKKIFINFLKNKSVKKFYPYTENNRKQLKGKITFIHAIGYQSIMTSIKRINPSTESIIKLREFI